MAKNKTKTKISRIKDLTPVKSLASVITSLEIEFDEIAGRVERLDAALNRKGFIEQVGEEQSSLLSQQYIKMRDYRDLLAIRLCLLRRVNAKAIENEIKSKG